MRGPATELRRTTDSIVESIMHTLRNTGMCFGIFRHNVNYAAKEIAGEFCRMQKIILLMPHVIILHVSILDHVMSEEFRAAFATGNLLMLILSSMVQGY